MVFGIDDALLAAGITAAGSVAGGALAGRSQGNKETKIQKKQRHLIDRLIESLSGGGEYSDLYSTDMDAFNKSFVQPAQSMFRNKIAPQIQQQYIAGGQQRGTGLDDTLTRAGVDLDAMLNQYLYQSQQDALNRKQSTINQILGGGAGAANTPSTGQNVMGAIGGYLSSEGFSDSVSNIFKDRKQPEQRKGFENDPKWDQTPYSGPGSQGYGR